MLCGQEVQLYEIAYLLRMPVFLVKQMPYEELLGWFEFFKLNPPGWQEDKRTFTILQALGVKASPEKIFPSLAPTSSNDLNGLKSSALFKRMMSAVGGDSLSL